MKMSCTAITAAGKQCSRAQRINSYCLQHYKIYVTTGANAGANAGASAGAISDSVVLYFDPDEDDSKMLVKNSLGENKIYEEAIMPHIFGLMNMLSGEDYISVFNAEIKLDTSTSSTRAKRIAQEMKFIKSNLPVHFNSSIAIRFDNYKHFIIKVLIFGPPQTPYDSGCFEFDMYIPPNYPNVPPNMLITTTNGGSVRFSPNLYSNGKVCLSLLGTWPGNTSEKWSKTTSNIWQVLISVQSAILGESEPMFLEPGYEKMRGTKKGNMEKYTIGNGGILNLREQNIKCAMIEYIRKPPVGFEELVLNHFKNKRDYIKMLTMQWVDEAISMDFTDHLARLKNYISILEVELDKLT